MTTPPASGPGTADGPEHAAREPGEHRAGGPPSRLDRARGDGDHAPSRLDRAPGERYARPAPTIGRDTAPPGSWSARQRLAAAVAVAAVGALVLLVVGDIDLGLGLVAVTAATGWLTGLALAGGASPGRGSGAGAARAAGAGLIAGAGTLAGLLADGLRALSEGGVLAPPAYVGERFGTLAILLVASAALVAALRGR